MAIKFNVAKRHNKFRWPKNSVQLGVDKTIVKGKKCRKNHDNLKFCTMMALHVSLSFYFKVKTMRNV